MPGNLLKIQEKSWKNHGILLGLKSGNPDCDTFMLKCSVKTLVQGHITKCTHTNELKRLRTNITCCFQGSWIVVGYEKLDSARDVLAAPKEKLNFGNGE